MQKIKDLSVQELKDLMKLWGYPSYRGQQIYVWQSQKLVKSFDEMSNLPKDLLARLKENFLLESLKMICCEKSQDGSTQKLLCELSDGNLIESVIMKYSYGYSVCVSTQVGCKMGCVFCESGAAGFVRNLTPAEILEQVILAQRLVGRISRVVMMGIGEPLDNFENVLKFILLVSDPNGLGIGQRKITISTSGLVDKMRMLAKQKLQCGLSVSLHAPNDEIRNRIMPINQKWRVSELIACCKDYFVATRRRITFEYTLIDGVNDEISNAVLLAQLVRGFASHINLIPVNSGGNSSIKAPTAKKIKDFRAKLEELGILATKRRTLGVDILAGCGQLRSAKEDKGFAECPKGGCLGG